MSNPTFQEFSSLLNSEVASNVPETVIYSVSGTRRSAVLAGISPNGDEYAAWSRQEMIRCLKIIFEHGVKNVVMPILTPSQFNETTDNYREHLWRWIDWGLVSDKALLEFSNLGWYVNIPFSEFVPELTNARERLSTLEEREGAPRLWIFVTPSHNQLMEWMLQKIQSSGPVANTNEAIKLIYGSFIPPAELYLDFGKPIVSPDLVPPFLGGVMNCYWSQQPGYSLSTESFRTILYDYLYLRKTWQKDKTGRSEQILDNRNDWKKMKVIGLGKKLGPYWYPVE
ncbi:MAG: hypothetical protein ACI9EW_000979 [Cellvibrionaceae bacterium]